MPAIVTDFGRNPHRAISSADACESGVAGFVEADSPHVEGLAAAANGEGAIELQLPEPRLDNRGLSIPLPPARPMRIFTRSTCGMLVHCRSVNPEDSSRMRK
jgi:hypothetical protein